MTTKQKEKLEKTIREKLIEARFDAALSQAEAGKLVGRYQSFIAKIESGERNITAIELIELAEIYNKPLEFFFK